jgi:hypothetical protein
VTRREKAVRSLRISFRVGAAVDLVAAAQLAFPAAFGLSMALEPDPHDAGVAASLLVGWAALLLWADRRPLARRDVLALGTVPAVAALVLGEASMAALRSSPVDPGLAALVLQLAVAALFAWSWWRTRDAARFFLRMGRA